MFPVEVELALNHARLIGLGFGLIFYLWALALRDDFGRPE
jgi:hypothetical protein